MGMGPGMREATQQVKRCGALFSTAFNSHYKCEVCIMPTLQMTEVRLREVKWLVHTHTGPSGAAGLRPAIPGGETQAKTQRGAEASSWSTSSCDSSLLPPQNWVWTQEPPFQGLIHHQPSDPKLDPTLFYFVTISFLQPMRKTATPLPSDTWEFAPGLPLSVDFPTLWTLVTAFPARTK